MEGSKLLASLTHHEATKVSRVGSIEFDIPADNRDMYGRLDHGQQTGDSVDESISL
jgi:hypothetical protein